MCNIAKIQNSPQDGYTPLLDPEEVGKPEPKWHKNATLVMVASFFLCLVESLSLGSLFDIYLFDLFNSNSFVGSVESVRGLTALVMAIPLGIIGDKCNRRKVLVNAATMGFFSLFLVIYAIIQDSVMGLYVSISCWAIANQAMLGNMQAMLADSLPSGPARVTACTYSAIAVWLGLAAGPALQMGMMAYFGNTWDFAVVKFVIIVGLTSYLAVLPAVFSLECVNSLKEQMGKSAQKAWSQETVFGIRKMWLIPIIINVGNLIVSVGAGMTVKFFPLFFKQEYDLLPVSLNMINLIFPLCIAVLNIVLERLGDKMGRAQACALFQSIGTAGLFLLSFSKPLSMTIVLFLVRGAFMNARGSLNQSILMDCVDPAHRGRWSSVQTLGQATWAGSAALGGWLADSHSYRFTFLITAVIYTIATLSYFPTMLFVPKELKKQ